jgi:3-deoxy-D-manno-octulosonic acid kinase
LGVFRALPPDYETWNFPGGGAVVRHAVADAVRITLSSRTTLYDWASRQTGRDVFRGRGEAYGVQLGPVRAVVRHARRGGLLARFLDDRYLGAPRFLREILIAGELARAGIPTPAVLAGVMYAAGLMHRADIATERVDGRDLAALFFGDAAPAGSERSVIWRAVGALVRRLHNAGFVHPDLQLRNVLVVRAGSLTPDPWLLDIDTCRRVAAGDEESRRANLARFDRSWAKWNTQQGPRLTPVDRADFDAGYADRAP